MLKRLAKQRKHYLSLPWESFKNWENLKQKREAGNTCQKPKWEVSSQKLMGGLESLPQTEKKSLQHFTTSSSLASPIIIRGNRIFNQLDKLPLSNQ